MPLVWSVHAQGGSVASCPRTHWPHRAPLVSGLYVSGGMRHPNFKLLLINPPESCFKCHRRTSYASGFPWLGASSPKSGHRPADGGNSHATPTAVSSLPLGNGEGHGRFSKIKTSLSWNNAMHPGLSCPLLLTHRIPATVRSWRPAGLIPLHVYTSSARERGHGRWVMLGAVSGGHRGC